MNHDWGKFIEFLTKWCESESNRLGDKFECKCLEEKIGVKILYTNRVHNRKAKLVFSKDNYKKLTKDYEDSEICSNIIQIIKDRYRYTQRRTQRTW